MSQKNEMKNVFMAGDPEPINTIINHLRKKGFNVRKGNFIGYTIAMVKASQYIDALKQGMDIVEEKELGVYWVNAENDRQYGHSYWPVAYGLLDIGLFCGKKAENSRELELSTKKKNNPKFWMNAQYCIDNNNTRETPNSIIEMTNALKKRTGMDIAYVANNSDYALEIKVNCHHSVHEEVREEVLKYLMQSNLFRKIYSENLDGTIVEPAIKEKEIKTKTAAV